MTKHTCCCLESQCRVLPKHDIKVLHDCPLGMALAAKSCALALA